MRRLNRDVYVALVLLVVCGVFFWQTLLVPQMGYASLEADVWPQFVIAILLLLSLGYLFQSLRRGAGPSVQTTGRAWFVRYRNALWCYALFFLFLLSLEWLGMLIGGVLFVFLTLTAIGDRTPRALTVHAAIAVVSMAGMWAIFTFGLGVMLPPGEILRVW